LRDLDDRITIGFRKAVTRRTVLQRSLRWTLAAGTAMSVSWKWWVSDAAASNCSYYGVRGSSLYCATTGDCPYDVCTYRGNVISYHKRCDAWTHQTTQENYCWCSQSGWTGANPRYGMYVCCDGWKQRSTNGCAYSSGRTRCICAHWHMKASTSDDE
jgi:hypothetical protein